VAYAVALLAPPLAFYAAANNRELVWVMAASGIAYLLGLGVLAWGIYEDGAHVVQLAFPSLLVAVAGAFFGLVVGCGFLKECFP